MLFRYSFFHLDHNCSHVSWYTSPVSRSYQEAVMLHCQCHTIIFATTRYSSDHWLPVTLSSPLTVLIWRSQMPPKSLVEGWIQMHIRGQDQRPRKVTKSGGSKIGRLWRAREREPITGVWGLSPQRPGQEASQKLNSFLLLDVHWKRQICIALYCSTWVEVFVT